VPANPRVAAVLAATIVLAADLGEDGLDTVKGYRPSVPPLGRLRTPAILAS
jgi:hypothetical protein